MTTSSRDLSSHQKFFFNCFPQSPDLYKLNHLLKINLRDISFDVDETSCPDAWEYIRSGKWEQESFDAIDRYVHPKATVLDIGCWDGPLSLYMAGKEAMVYAFDPDPKAYSALLTKLELNPELKKRIRPFPMAIGAETGTIELYARRAYGQSSTSTLARTRDKVAGERVRQMTLAAFLQSEGIDSVNFINMDIEGGEFRLLEEAAKTIASLGYPTILRSLQPGHLNEAIYNKKLPWRLFSLAMMKVEKYFGIRFFRKALLREISPVVELAKKYAYVYDPAGPLIPKEKLGSSLLLRSGIDLFMSKFPREQET